MCKKKPLRGKDSFLILRKGLLLWLNCFLGLCMFNNILKMKFILVRVDIFFIFISACGPSRLQSFDLE